MKELVHKHRSSNLNDNLMRNYHELKRQILKYLKLKPHLSLVVPLLKKQPGPE